MTDQTSQDGFMDMGDALNVLEQIDGLSSAEFFVRQTILSAAQFVRRETGCLGCHQALLASGLRIGPTYLNEEREEKL